MSTAFDFLTVGCFFGLVIAFFQLTRRDTHTLLRLMIPAVAFAIANQIGNAGLTVFALVLLFAGAGYAALIVKNVKLEN
jgi:hypothetical protein